MNRGRARQATFLDVDAYQAFLDTLAEVHRLWGIEFFAYCLMRYHYHICLLRLQEICPASYPMLMGSPPNASFRTIAACPLFRGSY